MKLWEKSVQVDKDIEKYTIGRDREMDLYLAPFDVMGSMAHITMLESIGLLTADELKVLLAEMKQKREYVAEAYLANNEKAGRMISLQEWRDKAPPKASWEPEKPA